MLKYFLLFLVMRQSGTPLHVGDLLELWKFQRGNRELTRETFLSIHYMHNPIIHLFYPLKILHNHCLQVLLGREDVLREIKNNAYANFWGVEELYCGICASSE